MKPEDDLSLILDTAAQIILRSEHLTTFVGAGMSAASGIPTFRGPGGLWTKTGEPDMRGYDVFLEDPKRWWENRLASSNSHMVGFTKALDQAKPNLGHYSLASMEREGILKYIITQNVDNLHQEAGSFNVVEIHGNRLKYRCVNCVARFERPEISLEILPPRCPKCQGLIKGDGVMFGEPIPNDTLELCQRQALMSDCMILIGTSAVVYPAAGLPELTRQKGGILIEMNPMPTPLSDKCDLILRVPSNEGLPLLLERIRAFRDDTS